MRNSLAFGVSNHCFVEVLLCRQLYLRCFPLAFPFQHTPTVLSAGTFNIALAMVALEQNLKLQPESKLLVSTIRVALVEKICQ